MNGHPFLWCQRSYWDTHISKFALSLCLSSPGFEEIERQEDTDCVPLNEETTKTTTTNSRKRKRGESQVDTMTADCLEKKLKEIEEQIECIKDEVTFRKRKRRKKSETDDRFLQKMRYKYNRCLRRGLEPTTRSPRPRRCKSGNTSQEQQIVATQTSNSCDNRLPTPRIVSKRKGNYENCGRKPHVLGAWTDRTREGMVKDIDYLFTESIKKEFKKNARLFSGTLVRLTAWTSDKPKSEDWKTLLDTIKKYMRCVSACSFLLH